MDSSATSGDGSGVAGNYVADAASDLSRGKTTAETTVPARVETGQLIPQPHGGALRNGGTNRGGPGRPPSEIRAACRADFDALRGKLVAIARSRKAKDVDKVRAINVLGKYGLAETLSAADVNHALEQTVAEIVEFMGRDGAGGLLARIAPIWLQIG